MGVSPRAQPPRANRDQSYRMSHLEKRNLALALGTAYVTGTALAFHFAPYWSLWLKALFMPGAALGLFILCITLLLIGA